MSNDLVMHGAKSRNKKRELDRLRMDLAVARSQFNYADVDKIDEVIYRMIDLENKIAECMKEIKEGVQ